MAKRLHEKKGQKINNPNYKLLLGIASLSAAVFALAISLAYHTATEKNGRIKTISFSPLNKSQRTQLTKLASNLRGKPLYSINAENIYSQVKQFSWIKSIAIERIHPDTLNIKIEKRIAMATFGAQNTLYVDENADLFKSASVKTSLPNIAINKTKNNRQDKQYLMSAIAAIKAYNKYNINNLELKEIEVDESIGITAHLPNEKLVVLGSDRYEEKWKRFFGIAQKLDSQGTELTYIYLANLEKDKLAARLLNKSNKGTTSNATAKRR